MEVGIGIQGFLYLLHNVKKFVTEKHDVNNFTTKSKQQENETELVGDYQGLSRFFFAGADVVRACFSVHLALFLYGSYT